MATVAASLKLFDQFSSTMLKAQQTMNTVIQTAQQLKQSLQGKLTMNLSTATATNQMNQVRQQTQATVTAANQLTHPFQAVVATQQQMVQTQQRVNSSLVNAKSSTMDWLGTLKNIATTYLSIQAGQRLVAASIGGYAQQQRMKDMLIARTGDEEVGTAMFEKFKADALKTGQDVKAALTGTLSFFSMTQNTNELAQLNRIAQKLSAFDTTGQGLSGATFSVKEAMSGDIISLAERFNMSKSMIRSVKLDDYGKAGNIPKFIAAFNQLLEMQKMGESAFQRMMDSPIKKAEILKNNLKSAMADSGQSAVNAFMPLIDTLNRAFTDGKFTSFFNSIQIGMSIMAQITGAAVNFILDHMNLLQNMLIALGVTLTVLAGIWLVNWIIAAWPVFLVIGAIMLLLGVLNHFGISTGEVVGFVVGVFYTMYARIKNVIALIWNNILAFAEFLVNVFIDPVYAVKKLFYDLAYNVSDFITNMINSCLGKINAMIEKLNKIPGINIPVIGKLDNKWTDFLKPTTDKNVVDLSKFRMEQVNTGDAFQAGYDKVMDTFSGTSFKGLTDSFDFSNWNKTSDINRVNSVGKIEDKVDISSEDLKVMRELAELKAIQNFVTLTPTVQVTTGDINQGADLDTMIARITQHLEEDIVSSAQGVYG
jgi:hypothetical protein